MYPPNAGNNDSGKLEKLLSNDSFRVEKRRMKKKRVLKAEGLDAHACACPADQKITGSKIQFYFIGKIPPSLSLSLFSGAYSTLYIHIRVYIYTGNITSWGKKNSRYSIERMCGDA